MAKLASERQRDSRFARPVARLTERHEVLQAVRGEIVSAERSAWNDMVDVEARPALLDPAVLASMRVAVAGEFRLLAPIRPVVRLDSAAPHRPPRFRVLAGLAATNTRTPGTRTPRCPERKQ